MKMISVSGRRKTYYNNISSYSKFLDALHPVTGMFPKQCRKFSNTGHSNQPACRRIKKTGLRNQCRSFLFNRKFHFLLNKKRSAGIELGWKRKCRFCGPPQAENPASQDSLLLITLLKYSMMVLRSPEGILQDFRPHVGRRGAGQRVAENQPEKRRICWTTEKKIKQNMFQ